MQAAMRAALRLVFSSAVLLSACEPSPAPSPPPPAKAASARPPQPMMASAAWGEQVALTLGKDITAGTTPPKDLVASAMTMLLSLQPGAEQQARTKLLQAWKGAADNETRGLALALTALSLVFDPTVEGYVERLTDAYGLAQYSGTVDSSAAEGQCARAIVGAAGGATRQSRDLIDLVARMARLPEGTKPWLALARGSANDRSQAFFDEAAAGLLVRPDAWRLRAMLGDRLTDLGFTDDAIAAISGYSPAEAPAAVTLVKARAQVLGGQAAAAVPVLQGLVSSLAGVDEARRSEAIYWLAEAQLVTNDSAAAKATAAQLEVRPGWQREAALVASSLALRDGRLEEAQRLLAPLSAGTPMSTVPVERRISRLMLDICAELKDSACVERATRRLAIIDVDVDGADAARVRAERADGIAALSGADIWKQVVEPSSSTAGVARARRAIASGAPGLARRELDGLVKQPALRVARALRAIAQEKPAEQAALAMKALAGAGPPLGETDTLAIIDVLGAAPAPGSVDVLKGLEKDPRPLVQKAATRSLSDLADPAARAARLAPQGDEQRGHGHVDGPGGKPPGAPTRPVMPGLPGMPGMPGPQPGAPAP